MINQLMTTKVVFVTKYLITFIMVVTSWEVVGIKQITNIKTSVATRVTDHTNVLIVITWIAWL